MSVTGVVFNSPLLQGNTTVGPVVRCFVANVLPRRVFYQSLVLSVKFAYAILVLTNTAHQQMILRQALLETKKNQLVICQQNILQVHFLNNHRSLLDLLEARQKPS